MNKKGISPLIATVIIIGLVIVLSVLILLFGQNLIQKTIEQEEEKSTLLTSDVKVTAYEYYFDCGLPTPELYILISNDESIIIKGFVSEIRFSNGLQVINIDIPDFTQYDRKWFTFPGLDCSLGSILEVTVIPKVIINDNLVLATQGKSTTNKLSANTPDLGQTCGNNIREGTEECDGSDLNNETCQSLGFPYGGTLSCNNCLSDTSQCVSDLPSYLIDYRYTFNNNNLTVIAEWNFSYDTFKNWTFTWDRSGVYDTSIRYSFRESNVYYAKKTADFVREKMWNISAFSNSGPYRFLGSTARTGWPISNVSHPTWDAMQIMGLVWLYERTDNQTYLDWAKEYSTVFFGEWDPLYGGWDNNQNYTYDSTKESWDMSFPSYALSLLYKKTSNNSHLDLSKNAANILINNYFDPVHGGFYNQCNRDYSFCWDMKKNSEYIGSIGQAFMLLYEITGNTTYLDYAREANNFIVGKMWTSPSMGIPLDTNRTGDVKIWFSTSSNNNHWATLGLTDYHYLLGNGTYKQVALNQSDFIYDCYWDTIYGGHMRYINNPPCSISDEFKFGHLNVEHGWMHYKDFLKLDYEPGRDRAEQMLDYVSNNFFDDVNGGIYSLLTRDNIILINSKENLFQAGTIIGFSYPTAIFRNPENSTIQRILKPSDSGKTIRFYLSAHNQAGNEFQTPVFTINVP